MAVSSVPVDLTTASGSSYDNAPEIAAYGDGYWMIYYRTVGTTVGIYAQRYDASGSAVGARIELAPAPATNPGQSPEIINLGNGTLAAFWGESTSIKATIINGETGEFTTPVTLLPKYNNLTHEVALLDNGRIALVTMVSDISNPSGVRDKITLHTFDSNLGTPSAPVVLDGGDFPASGGNFQDYNVIANGDGGVAFYRDRANDSWELYGQRFDGDGALIGSKFQINTTAMVYWTALSAGTFQVSSTELANGGFVVVWTSQVNTSGSNAFDIRARVFDADGNPMGADFQVNGTGAQQTRNQYMPEVTALPNGTFAVTWLDEQSIFNQEHYVRYYAADGTPLTAAILTETIAKPIIGDADADVALLADGTLVDVFLSGVFVTTIAAQGLPMPQFGSDGDDPLAGGGGDDLFVGGEGNDVLEGFSGRDVLAGGPGDDWVSGGDNGDTLEGGPGIDMLDYGYRTEGVNINLRLATQSNTFENGSADTTAGFENLRGGAGNDTLIGDGGYNYIEGGDGADTIFGDDRAGTAGDYLVGGAGNDTFYAQQGYNYIDGGDGFDLVQALATSADQYVDLSVGAYSMANRSDIWVSIEGVAVSSGNDTVLGGEGANLVTGYDGNDILIGRGGDDQLQGMQNNDYLDGGEGNDLLSGGTGVNVLRGGEGHDIASYSSVDNSTVQTTFGQTLWADLAAGAFSQGSIWDSFDSIEGLKGSDQARNTLWGDAFANTLVGGEANDVLSGRDGNDLLRGRSQDDWLDGGAGDDRLEGGDGVDLLIGGAGADVFAVSSRLGSEWDVVRDFSLADGDRLSIEQGYTFSGFVEADLNADGITDTLLGYSGGNIAVLGVSGLTVDDWNALLVPWT